MKANDYVEFTLYLAILIALTPPLGKFMAKVLEGEKTWLSKPLGWLEKLTYKISGIDSSQEMNWKEYAKALMVFNIQLAFGAEPLEFRLPSGSAWRQPPPFLSKLEIDS